MLHHNCIWILVRSAGGYNCMAFKFLEPKPAASHSIGQTHELAAQNIYTAKITQKIQFKMFTCKTTVLIFLKMLFSSENATKSILSILLVVLSMDTVTNNDYEWCTYCLQKPFQSKLIFKNQYVQVCLNCQKS